MKNLTEGEKRFQPAAIPVVKEQLQFIPGIWVNGKYFWLQNSSEKVIYDEELVIKVKQEEIHSKIRLSSVYISNHSNQVKDLKVLAMYHYPYAKGDQLTFVSPAENKIFHFANRNVFLVNGYYNGIGMRECTAMPLWNAFTDKIWSSVKKGNLKYQPMAKGLAVSIYTVHLEIAQHETKKMNTWVISGTNKNEVISLEQALLKNTLAIPAEK